MFYTIFATKMPKNQDTDAGTDLEKQREQYILKQQVSTYRPVTERIKYAVQNIKDLKKAYREEQRNALSG